MAKIIADTYQIEDEIGSGGNGIVYMGRHIRLNKPVVLKADKRTLSARPEALRREVDALKNLSHTYIPQVYDFIEEDGSVYTVMDYIEGESLDKLLSRGEKLAQPTLIEVACELLEALSYLHHRPPYGILHGDIKPANIMATPEGDIRLIDFNIALALGEEGAVRVGFSRGYASPEHYGLDYSTPHTGATQPGLSEKTEVSTGSASMADNPSGSTFPDQQKPRKTVIMLDVRSDIYSVGATLYHLLTGRRPDWDAKKVEPLRKDECSPAVAGIINKAMRPDPGDRYQTVDEMLAAFRGLHENDPRMRRHRRRVAVSAVVLSVLFLAGGGCTFVGLKQMQQLESNYALAEYSENALQQGDVKLAIDYALQALPEERGIFDPPYIPQAQKALTDALGVYDLADGFNAHLTIELPSEPLKVSISPGGTRIAVIYAFEMAVYGLESGNRLTALPAEPSALSDVDFVNDDILLYAGEGGIRAYNVTEGREMWAGQPATTIVHSADGARAAAVYKDEDHAVIYNIADGSIAGTVSFGGRKQSVATNDTMYDPDTDLFALNHDGTMLGASFSDGSLEIFNIFDPENGFILFDPSEYTDFEGGFFDKYFAFAASGDHIDCLLDFIDVEAGEETGNFVNNVPFHVKTNEKGIFVSSGNVLVKIDPVTGDQTEVAYTDADAVTSFSTDGEYAMIATAKNDYILFREGAIKTTEGTSDNSCDFVAAAGDYAVIGSLNSPSIRVLRRENHDDLELFSYDPEYQHDEARLSADGSTVMLFSIDGFRLYQTGGELITEVWLTEPEQIYDQQYRRDENGSRLEVTYYDGTIKTYSAADGSLISEKKAAAPDKSATEEFYTDDYHIVAPVHEAPKVYARDSGELVCELETDAYLTYVTQIEGGIITEYINSDNQRYGLLLDGECRTLARLPYMCDYINGKVIFDYPTGIMRQSRVYSIEELLSMART